MKKSLLCILGLLFVGFILAAKADGPPQPTACNAIAGDASRRAINWLEDRVVALEQLERPTEQDAALLKEYQTRLQGMDNGQSSGEGDEKARCTPATEAYDTGDKVS